MKSILALTILSIAYSFVFGQVNPKKCMTTDLVKEEFK